MFQKDEVVTTSKLKPIRGAQYLLAIFLYHLGIFLYSIPETYMSQKVCSFLILMSFIYATITGVAMMVQRSSDPIRINLMLVFCFFGIPLFIIVGFMSLFSRGSVSSYWAVQVATLFSFSIAAAFLIEILMVFPLSMRNRILIPPRPNEEIALFRGIFKRK